MLTDYHVHLRPDDDDTAAEDYFTPGNAERYREIAEDRGIAECVSSRPKGRAERRWTWAAKRNPGDGCERCAEEQARHERAPRQ